MATCDCALCFSECSRKPSYIDGNAICPDCIATSILPKFDRALRYETEYPVKWSEGIELQLQDFSESSPNFEAYSTAWQKKTAEYAVPHKHRLYCRKSESFLRRRATRFDAEDGHLVYCPCCQVWVCGKCGEAEHDASMCEIEIEKEVLDPFEGVTGLKRCPNKECSTPMLLYDGCNAVKCKVCTQKFCWVCLARNPMRNHWALGRPCPRYNQPGVANVQFDDDEGDQYDDEEDEMEDNESDNDDNDDDLEHLVEAAQIDDEQMEIERRLLVAGINVWTGWFYGTAKEVVEGEMHAGPFQDDAEQIMREVLDTLLEQTALE